MATPSVNTTQNESVGVRSDGVEIVVDLNTCIAAGPCAITAPNVFQIRDSDGKAVIKNPDGDTIETILDAARSCPILAIKIKKDNRFLFP